MLMAKPALKWPLSHGSRQVNMSGFQGKYLSSMDDALLVEHRTFIFTC